MDTKDFQTKLDRYGQAHLLKFWDQLSDDDKSTFLKELQSIDYAYVKETYEKAMQQLKQDQEKKDELMKPLPEHVFERLSESEKNKTEHWYKEGLKKVSQGKVAVLLLAGGQGTRLGVSYPKGMYDVGLPSHKTLYQLQAERILKLQSLAQEMHGDLGTITWYAFSVCLSHVICMFAVYFCLILFQEGNRLVVPQSKGTVLVPNCWGVE